jgi:hypothetical protein
VIDSKVAQTIARGFYWLLPNLAAFDVKSQVVHAMPVPVGYLVLTLLYGVAYVATLLTMAVMIFSRRDFK